MNSNDITEEQISLAYSRKKYNDKHEDVFRIEKTDKGYWISKKSSRMFIPFDDVDLFESVGAEVGYDFRKYNTKHPTSWQECLERDEDTASSRILWCFKYVRKVLFNSGYSR